MRDAKIAKIDLDDVVAWLAKNPQHADQLRTLLGRTGSVHPYLDRVHDPTKRQDPETQRAEELARSLLAIMSEFRSLVEVFTISLTEGDANREAMRQAARSVAQRVEALGAGRGIIARVDLRKPKRGGDGAHVYAILSSTRSEAFAIVDDWIAEGDGHRDPKCQRLTRVTGCSEFADGDDERLASNLGRIVRYLVKPNPSDARALDLDADVVATGEFDRAWTDHRARVRTPPRSCPRCGAAMSFVPAGGALRALVRRRARMP